jgi:GAF domain-containing protein
MVAPITEAGTVVGFIAVVDRIGDLNSFEPSDARMFETLASHASIALENGRLIDRLHDEARQREHEALHDALTGLPNRVLFHRRLLEGLTDIEAGGGSIAVAVMDLDGFKEINDTLGHQARRCGARRDRPPAEPSHRQVDDGGAPGRR